MSKAQPDLKTTRGTSGGGMPRPTLVMIHTVARIADDLRTMCRGLIPEATVLDIVASALLSHVLAPAAVKGGQ